MRCDGTRTRGCETVRFEDSESGSARALCSHGFPFVLIELEFRSYHNLLTVGETGRRASCLSFECDPQQIDPRISKSADRITLECFFIERTRPITSHHITAHPIPSHSIPFHPMSSASQSLHVMPCNVMCSKVASCCFLSSLLVSSALIRALSFSLPSLLVCSSRVAGSARPESSREPHPVPSHPLISPPLIIPLLFDCAFNQIRLDRPPARLSSSFFLHLIGVSLLSQSPRRLSSASMRTRVEASPLLQMCLCRVAKRSVAVARVCFLSETRRLETRRDETSRQ